MRISEKKDCELTISFPNNERSTSFHKTTNTENNNVCSFFCRADLLHTYFSLAGLSLLRCSSAHSEQRATSSSPALPPSPSSSSSEAPSTREGSSGGPLKTLHPALNIPLGAVHHLRALHARWGVALALDHESCSRDAHRSSAITGLQ